LNLSHGWSRAGLSIYSDSLDLEAVESALGLRATGKHLKGTPRSRDLKPIWPDSMWRFGTSLSNDHGLEGNLTLILDALEPKRDVIQGFAHEHRVDFFCGFSSGEREGGFTLTRVTFTRVTLNRVAKFGVPLITNLSPPIPLEIDQEVAGEVQTCAHGALRRSGSLGKVYNDEKLTRLWTYGPRTFIHLNGGEFPGDHHVKDRRGRSIVRSSSHVRLLFA